MIHPEGACSKEKAPVKLYKTYWALMMTDILAKLNPGFPPTQENKEMLHEFHKRVLGYESIAGRSKEYVQNFLFDVCVFWAVEKGIFVRTKAKQPIDIEDRSFLEVIDLL
jgi:hypothetical protein